MEPKISTGYATDCSRLAWEIEGQYRSAAVIRLE